MRLDDDLILHEMRRVVRQTGKPAASLTLAMRLGVSQRSMQVYLSRLEAAAKIIRPMGKKRGYTINEPLRVLIRQDDLKLTGRITQTVHRCGQKSRYLVTFDSETTAGWFKSKQLQIAY